MTFRFVCSGRIVGLFLVLSVLAACQTDFVVEPARPQLTMAVTPANAVPLEVSGTEHFDQLVQPVTFFCSAAKFTIKFSEEAESIIKDRIRSGVPAARAGDLAAVDVAVTNVFLRTMSLMNSASVQRFDVEGRIGLSANVKGKDNAVRTETVAYHGIIDGEPDTEHLTCAIGKVAIERALPMLLDDAIGQLVEKI